MTEESASIWDHPPFVGWFLISLVGTIVQALIILYGGATQKFNLDGRQNVQNLILTGVVTISGIIAYNASTFYHTSIITSIDTYDSAEECLKLVESLFRIMESSRGDLCWNGMCNRPFPSKWHPTERTQESMMEFTSYVVGNEQNARLGVFSRLDDVTIVTVQTVIGLNLLIFGQRLLSAPNMNSMLDEMFRWTHFVFWLAAATEHNSWTGYEMAWRGIMRKYGDVIRASIEKTAQENQYLPGNFRDWWEKQLSRFVSDKIQEKTREEQKAWLSHKLEWKRLAKEFAEAVGLVTLGLFVIWDLWYHGRFMINAACWEGSLLHGPICDATLTWAENFFNDLNEGTET